MRVPITRFSAQFLTPQQKGSSGLLWGSSNLHAACRALDLRVIAIGGVTLENSAECVHAGAAGIAAIRMFQQTWEPARTREGCREGYILLVSRREV